MLKTDVYDQIWQTRPKVHERVVRDLSYDLTRTTSYSAIWTMVELAGVRDDEDILVTTRALRDIRNQIWPK